MKYLQLLLLLIIAYLTGYNSGATRGRASALQFEPQCQPLHIDTPPQP